MTTLTMKMATMKKITKPASTTIAVFVTCIEILWRNKTKGVHPLLKSCEAVDIFRTGWRGR